MSFVIGIAGGSGSGKSTLIDQLQNGRFVHAVSVLPHDAYYHDLIDMPAALRDDMNFDHPDALDTALFVEHLTRLKAGHSVMRPVYDFETYRRSTKVEEVAARPVLLVDGILLFAIPEVRDRLDLRVYVQAPPEERLARRITRDIVERGRSVESVVTQFRRTVRPMHDRYVEPSRGHAHLIVPWDWESDHAAAVEVLTARVGLAVGNQSGSS